MAFRRNYLRDKRIASFRGIHHDVQNIALSGAAAATPVSTTIRPYGTTVLTSTGTGGPHLVALGEPIPGVRKTVVVNMKTTADVAIVAHTTACIFLGTTANRATFSTAADGRTSIELMGISTASWAILGHGAQANTTATPTPAGYALAASTIAP